MVVGALKPSITFVSLPLTPLAPSRSSLAPSHSPHSLSLPSLPLTPISPLAPTEVVGTPLSRSLSLPLAPLSLPSLLLTPLSLPLLPLTPRLLPSLPLTPISPLAPTEVVGTPTNSIIYYLPSLTIGSKREQGEWGEKAGSKGRDSWLKRSGGHPKNWPHRW